MGRTSREWRERLAGSLDRTMRRGFGWWSIGWGVAYLLGIAALYLLVPRPPPVAMVILALLAFGALLQGTYFLLRAYRLRRRQDHRDRYRQVLELAGRRGGSVTLADILQETRLGPDEADAVLQGLQRTGRAEVDADEHGRLVYRFPEFTRPQIVVPPAILPPPAPGERHWGRFRFRE